MKNKLFYITLLSICIHFILCSDSFCQQSCKVVPKKLIGSYEGDCKKGAANGKGVAKGEDTYSGSFKSGYPDGEGIYTYSNGDVFTGTFYRGMLHGKGKMEVKNENIKDSVLEGYWFKNRYHVMDKDYEVILTSTTVMNITFTQLPSLPNEPYKLRFITKSSPSNYEAPGVTFDNLMGYYSNYKSRISPGMLFIEFEPTSFPFRSSFYFGFMTDIITQINKPGNWEVEFIIKHQ